jgi:hypothetical protein
MLLGSCGSMRRLGRLRSMFPVGWVGQCNPHLVCRSGIRRAT